MMRTFTKGLAVALALTLALLCLYGSALAETTVEQITDASVAFTYGELEWKDLGIGEGDGMDLNFSSHTTPMHDVVYLSVNGPHLLRISDAREPGETKAWSVTVRLSDFVMTGDGTETFQGTIALSNPSVVEGQDELTKSPTVEIASDGASVQVLEATANLGRGTFDTAWSDADTQLIIQQEEAVKIKAGTYKATLTWALIIGP